MRVRIAKQVNGTIRACRKHVPRCWAQSIKRVHAEAAEKDGRRRVGARAAKPLFNPDVSALAALQ